MSFLNKLLFVDANASKEEKKEEVKSFPTNTNTFPVSTPVVSTPKQEVAPIVCTPYIEEVIKVYEEGFDSLNQEGYDFFEFFKAIAKAGMENAPAYEMAFTMATSMDSKVSKQSLLEQSNFYITELKKVCEGFVKNGQASLQSIEKSKLEEGANLTKSLQETRAELERLKKLEESQSIALANIDTKYASKLQEVNCKIEANDIASKKLIGAIETVVNGIKTNIK